MSESSEDYSQIVQSLLMSQREWQEVPEIAHLTIKAICQHIEGMEDRILRNKQILTEQSIKLRQIDLKMENLTSEVYYEKQLLTGLDPLVAVETGFMKKKKESENKQKSKEKSKKKVENSVNHNITYGNESQFSQSIYDSKQKGENFNLEDLQNIANAMIEDRFKKFDKKIELQSEQFRKKMMKKTDENEKELEKWTKKIEEQLKQQEVTFSRNAIDLETKFSLKILQNQTEIMNVFEENFVTKNDFKKELKKKVDEIQRQSNRSSSEDKKGSKAPSRKKKQKHITTEMEQNKREKWARQPLVNANEYSSRQIVDVKFQIAKELHSYAKVADVETIMSKFHEELLKKICKLNTIVEGLEREINKKQMIHQFSSVSLRPTVPKKNHTERQWVRENEFQESDRKNSERSLASIQQSLKNLQKTFKEKIGVFKKQINSRMAESLQKLQKKFREDMEEREKYFCEVVEQNCKAKKIDSEQPMTSMGMNEANLKKIVSKLSSQMILARYLHYGEKECKEYISWEKQAFNAMEENFVWKSGANIITIIESGLYRVECGLYNLTDIEKVVAYLVLNGENIGAFPAQTLPKNTKAKAKGMILSEPLLIPAKSKISIRVESTFYGQAYLQVQKL